MEDPTSHSWGEDWVVPSTVLGTIGSSVVAATVGTETPIWGGAMGVVSLTEVVAGVPGRSRGGGGLGQAYTP